MLADIIQSVDLFVKARLNPYSNGMRVDGNMAWGEREASTVLILILMECVQTA